MSLDDLEKRVRQDLAYLDYPRRPWVPPRVYEGEPVLDVLIVGGGQAGLGTAFALRREAVENILVIDSKPDGREGPWIDFARMLTLRTPKYVSGADLGIPSLTPQAWYEARFGIEAWEKLGKIGRELWQNYLAWYRRVLDLPVRNGVALIRLTPVDSYLRAELSTGETVLTRRVVLATGIEGCGRWQIPPEIEAAIPRQFYAHTSEPIDFQALSGKRVGVLGAGASAFDNAATALEAGAASVDLCIRRTQIPAINPYRWMENAGYLGRFAELPEAIRWRMTRRIFDLNQPPPRETIARCQAFDNFAFHLGSPWIALKQEDDAVIVETPRQRFTFDFLIIGTGFVVDITERPELAGIAQHIALWKDRFTPAPDETHATLGNFPYLTADCAFTEKLPGSAPYLRQIHDFTFATMPSSGLTGGSISGLKYGIRRLVDGICRSLYVEDADYHASALLAYEDQELVDFSTSP